MDLMTPAWHVAGWCFRAGCSLRIVVLIFRKDWSTLNFGKVVAEKINARAALEKSKLSDHGRAHVVEVRTMGVCPEDFRTLFVHVAATHGTHKWECLRRYTKRFHSVTYRFGIAISLECFVIYDGCEIH